MAVTVDGDGRSRRWYREYVKLEYDGWDTKHVEETRLHKRHPTFVHNKTLVPPLRNSGLNINNNIFKKPFH